MQIPAEWSSWIPVSPQSDFPIQNIPFGIFSTNQKSPRAGVAIGDHIVDLSVLASSGLIQCPTNVLINPFLNDFIALGKSTTNQLRYDIAQLLEKNNTQLSNHTCKEEALVPMNQATMHLPVKVGDYTDFYSSKDHATNVGIMFRDPANALLPNWKHLPVGYHGRASSIVISGTPIHRPKGQTKPVETEPPVFGPSKRFDFELEVAFIVGKSTQLGESISTDKAEDHIFGLVLFNDLSARDIQNWEYVPLGPFLAKNFGSVISPWIVTLEALEMFRTEGEVQEPKVLPYLEFKGLKNYDINLEVIIQPEGGEENIVCESNFKYMYWNMCQQLAHHTVNGCNVNIGDMMASGTISGKEPHSFGSMLELAWKGTKPLSMKDGSTRTFLNDGDTNIIRGYGVKNGIRIGFGESRTKVLPAK